MERPKPWRNLPAGMTLPSEVAQPLIKTWREHRYEPILRAIMPARQQYDRLRREAGGLNYQDLLMKAADLLRDKPQIRRYFRKRFTHLLVDEFQDTDPIQAEVMLLLTAQRETETDWRKCRPVDGSLFVVGDPKQSIYRFRRADIATYNQVRQIIERSGGQVVALSANFRTIGPLVEWVNGTFDQVFPAEATVHAPARRPMQIGRTEGSDGELAGLRVLQVPSDCGNKDAIAEYEADLVARTIQAAITKGHSIPRSQKDLERGPRRRRRPAISSSSPGRKTGSASTPGSCRSWASRARSPAARPSTKWTNFGCSTRCLYAVTRPDDPVALVAILRGKLFGISDTDLYAFKRAGGRFSFHATIPEGSEAIGRRRSFRMPSSGSRSMPCGWPRFRPWPPSRRSWRILG